jgi:hypothetical protein
LRTHKKENEKGEWGIGEEFSVPETGWVENGGLPDSPLLISSRVANSVKIDGSTEGIGSGTKRDRFGVSTDLSNKADSEAHL